MACSIPLHLRSTLTPERSFQPFLDQSLLPRLTTGCDFSYSHQLMLIDLSFLDRINNVMQSTCLDGKPISLLFSLSPFWTAAVSSLYLNIILSDSCYKTR